MSIHKQKKGINTIQVFIPFKLVNLCFSYRPKKASLSSNFVAPTKFPSTYTFTV